MKNLLLFIEFFKTGLFAIGGGLATLPFLSKIGETYGWFTEQELANMLAVSESTPGPIGVNMATYVGNVTSGFCGGIITTIALILPSYLVISLVFRVMNKFHDNLYVQGAMKTLRPASVGMVAAASIGVLVSVLMNESAVRALEWSQMIVIPNMILFAVLFVFYNKFKNLHPVVILGIGAVAGIVFKL